jgi:quercetin dioxygenase-like cupin family protein
MPQQTNHNAAPELVSEAEPSAHHGADPPASHQSLLGLPAFSGLILPPQEDKGRLTIAGTLLALGLVLALGAGTLAVGRAAAPPEPSVTPVMAKELANIPGKEALMLLVTYPPGGADPVHRHDAHGFIYVLEGSIVMGVKGGKEVTLNPGQSFYEGPDDIHTVGRNASSSRPAKFLVLLIKDKGVPPFLPIQ